MRVVELCVREWAFTESPTLKFAKIAIARGLQIYPLPERSRANESVVLGLRGGCHDIELTRTEFERYAPVRFLA